MQQSVCLHIKWLGRLFIGFKPATFTNRKVLIIKVSSDTFAWFNSDIFERIDAIVKPCKGIGNRVLGKALIEQQELMLQLLVRIIY